MITLTFDREHLKRIVATTEAATSFSPTYNDLYDPLKRKDGREPTFDENPTYEDVDLTKVTPGLLLVADRGVYLMSNAKRAEGEPGDVAYAQEADPNKNEDWDLVREQVFGGDDGVEHLDLQLIKKWLENSSTQYAHIRVHRDQLEFI